MSVQFHVITRNLGLERVGDLAFHTFQRPEDDGRQGRCFNAGSLGNHERLQRLSGDISTGAYMLSRNDRSSKSLTKTWMDTMGGSSTVRTNDRNADI